MGEISDKNLNEDLKNSTKNILENFFKEIIEKHKMIEELLLTELIKLNEILFQLIVSSIYEMISGINFKLILQCIFKNNILCDMLNSDNFDELCESIFKLKNRVKQSFSCSNLRRLPVN